MGASTGRPAAADANLLGLINSQYRKFLHSASLLLSDRLADRLPRKDCSSMFHAAKKIFSSRYQADYPHLQNHFIHENCHFIHVAAKGGMG